jgi:hypothetical protein
MNRGYPSYQVTLISHSIADSIKIKNIAIVDLGFGDVPYK